MKKLTDDESKKDLLRQDIMMMISIASEPSEHPR